MLIQNHAWFFPANPQERGAAGIALDLTAGGFGNAPRLEQQDFMNAYVVILGNSSPDGLY